MLSLLRKTAAIHKTCNKRKRPLPSISTQAKGKAAASAAEKEAAASIHSKSKKKNLHRKRREAAPTLQSSTAGTATMKEAAPLTADSAANQTEAAAQYSPR
jgi:hypothetical protein